MIRRRSFSSMQRTAVWTAGTLFVLCGSLIRSEFVRSEEAPTSSSAFAAVSSQSVIGPAESVGAASSSDPDSEVDMADDAIAEKPIGWASIGEESVGSASIDDELEWQPTEGVRPTRLTSAADVPGWADRADESPGSVSKRDVALGRVAVFDVRPELAVVSGDGRSPAAVGDGRTGRTKLDASRDLSPAIVVAPDRGHATLAWPTRQGPTSPEGRGQLPVVSSRNDRTAEDPSATGRSTAANLFENELTPKITSKPTRQADEPKSLPSNIQVGIGAKVTGSGGAPNETGEPGPTSGLANAVEPSETSVPMPITRSIAPSIACEADLPNTPEEPVSTPFLSEPEIEPDTSVSATAAPASLPGVKAACCDEQALAEPTPAEPTIAENGESEDAASQPGWVTLELSGKAGKALVEKQAATTSMASDGGGSSDEEPRTGGASDAEGWRSHPTATLVEIGPTAAAPELLPVDVGGERESLPAPPRRSDSAILLSGGTASLADEGHGFQSLSDGPALAAPVVTRGSVETIAVSTLLSDETGRRKGSDLGTTHATSPRRLSLLEADDPPAFDPPPTPDGAEPPEPGSGGPVDLAPLVAPSLAADHNSSSAGPQLPGPGPGSRGTGQNRANADDQKLGKAPEDTSLRFLRQQTVLLKPGEMQFDVSFQYLNDKVDFVGVQQNNGLIQIAEAERRQRLLMVPMQLRVGIFEYTQAFVNVPFGWSNSESEFLGQDSATSSGGIGDVSAGVIKQIIVGNEFYPDVLTSISFSAPTGESSFLTALTTPGSNLGEGFWSLTSAITFIQNYDPVVLFYGGGYRHRFQEKFNGDTKVTPGSQFIYRFGVGFAVNPNVTLSATFNGSFIGELEVNGTNVGGSTQEPMQVRLAATINKRKLSKTHSSVKLVEPFVTFGLNDDAIDTVIGATWTF